MNSRLRSSMLAGGSCLLLLGCGPQTVSKDLLPVSFSTGGSVCLYYCRSSGGYSARTGDPLPGVTVTVDGGVGNISVAVTDSAGNWALNNLSPGAYNVTFRKEGYQPEEEALYLDAFGDNQVSNPYQSAGAIGMRESDEATFGPFGVTLQDGQVAYDGAGYPLRYSVSGGGDITMALSQRVTGVVYQGVTLIDHVTGRSISAVLDTSNGTTFRFTRSAIDGMNGGTPLTVGGNPLNLPEVRSEYVLVVTPSGRQYSYWNQLFFTADP